MDNGLDIIKAFALELDLRIFVKKEFVLFLRLGYVYQTQLDLPALSGAFQNMQVFNKNVFNVSHVFVGLILPVYPIK